MIASLVTAVRFLTIVPIPGRETTGDAALGRAAVWFPVIGLGLGTALAVLDRGLARVFPPLLVAALVLSLWKITTGGIHLDGLSDCLDGFAGRDRAQRLAIMRDSRIGTFGAIGLVVYFLIAFVALAESADLQRTRVLILAPVAGRVTPLVIGPLFRPATPGHGAGSLFMGAMSPWVGAPYLIATAALATWLFGVGGAVTTLASWLVVLLWSLFVARRLGGVTGDVLGSGIELAELAVLLGSVALVHHGTP